MYMASSNVCFFESKLAKTWLGPDDVSRNLMKLGAYLMGCDLLIDGK